MTLSENITCCKILLLGKTTIYYVRRVHDGVVEMLRCSIEPLHTQEKKRKRKKSKAAHYKKKEAIQLIIISLLAEFYL